MGILWEKFFKNFDKRLDVEDIYEFQTHFNGAVDRKLKLLDEQYKNLSEEGMEDPMDLDRYKDHLEDIMISTYSAKTLGHELSIIALYKKVELKIKKLAPRFIKNADSKNFSYYKQVIKAFPFIENLGGFDSYHELRLLNNAIKHGSEVSSELSTNFPIWIVGEELKDLDKAYERLLPGVLKFVSNFAEELHAITEKA
ncbi:Putative uncharacterized protein [Moritella viscosa]|uniref:hypothetical protein n=1 Tax=Moritella viscosa TaxID=80854 RepID=UPI000910A7EC|nr:hypothetical protein [Moritella viscosa]SGZ10119.1 Putative uncharacterized protein [Moritella viscosa]